MKNRLAEFFQNAIIALFCCLVFLAPIGTRKLIRAGFVGGGMNEYLSVFIYVSDVVLGLLIAFFLLSSWFFTGESERKGLKFWPNLNNGKPSGFLAILRDKLLFLFRKISRFLEMLGGSTSLGRLNLSLLLFLLWAGFTIFFARDKVVASILELRMITLALFLYIILWVARIKQEIQPSTKSETLNPKQILNPKFQTSKTWLTLNKKSLSFSFSFLSFVLTAMMVYVLIMCYQSIIAIAQFFLQKSIGLQVLGESILSKDLPGVAKITTETGNPVRFLASYGTKVVRAYGTLPHPNVLAGLLVIAIIFAIFLIFKRFLISNSQFLISNQILISNDKKADGNFWRSDLLREIGSQPLPRHGFDILSSLFYGVVLSVLLAGLFFTFSRSAWLALALSLVLPVVLLLVQKLRSSYLCSLYVFALTSIKKYFLIWFLPFLTIIALTIAYWPLVSQRLPGNLPADDLALTERRMYVKAVLGMIKKYPITGVGMGNFAVRLGEFVPQGTNLKIPNHKFQITNPDSMENSRRSRSKSQIPNSNDPNTFLKKEKPQTEIKKDLAYFSQNIKYDSRSVPRGTSFLKLAGLNSWVKYFSAQETDVNFLRSVLPIRRIGSRELQSEEEVLEPWQYQPVHNVFLLIAGEAGLVGLGLFLAFFLGWFWLIYRKTRGVDSLFIIAIFVALVVLMNLDHYFWTIQQGRLTFWITLALVGIFAFNRNKTLKSEIPENS